MAALPQYVVGSAWVVFLVGVASSVTTNTDEAGESQNPSANIVDFKFAFHWAVPLAILAAHLISYVCLWIFVIEIKLYSIIRFGFLGFFQGRGNELVPMECTFLVIDDSQQNHTQSWRSKRGLWYRHCVFLLLLLFGRSRQQTPPFFSMLNYFCSNKKKWESIGCHVGRTF